MAQSVVVAPSLAISGDLFFFAFSPAILENIPQILLVKSSLPGVFISMAADQTPLHLEYTLTRTKFNEITKNLVDRCIT
ncbi:hypothetical protein OC713_02620, partial [Sweet potato little leaf phytoplasma]|nr:hypothetical protein [Sweet potato little leaf phytoplasma]